MSNSFKNIVLFYVGFTSYITIETLYRGYSYFLMGMVGAICFLILDKINEYFSWELDLFIQGLIGSFIVTFMELNIGLLLKIFDSTMWDYSSEWLNYEGVICPLYSLFWVFLSIVAIIVADCINYYILLDEEKPKYNFLKFIKINFPERKIKC